MDEFGTQDPWLAAYLAVMGVPLKRVDILPNRRGRWVYERQSAMRLVDEFRRGRDTALAPIPAFRVAYMATMDAANAARERLPIGGSYREDERATA